MKKHLSQIVAGLLILSLISYSLKAEDTNSVTMFQLTPVQSQQQAKPAILEEICVVAIVGAIIAYAVYRCIEAAGLTNSPAPPSNGGTNTNSSSIVIAPADGGPLPPPGPTNTIPGTNSPIPTPSLIYFSSPLVTNNDENVETRWDISTNGWTDWQGNPYTWLVITHTDPTGPHVQTSTNLTTWTDYYETVYMWISSTVSPDPDMDYVTNMVTVVYDANNVPILTNFAAINPTTPVSINLGVRNIAPQMFFRGVTP